MGLRVGSSKINGVKVVGEDISRSVIITEETLPNGGIVKHFRGVAEGEWVRPSDWPDLSKLDRTGEVLYLTYPADEINGYNQIQCSGAFTLAVGHIENGSFVVESSANVANNGWNGLWFGSSNGGYKIIRVTPQSGGHLTKVMLFDKNRGGLMLNGHPVHPSRQYLLEAYGNLPYVTSMTFTYMQHMECFDVTNAKPTSLVDAFKHCRRLKSIRGTSTWDTSSCTSMSSTFQNCVDLTDINVSNLCKSSCTNLSNVFNTCTTLKKLDLSTWDTSNVTTFQNLFSSCRNLTELKLPSQFVKSSAIYLSYMFANTNSLQSTIDMSRWDTSNVTAAMNMFQNTTCFDVIDFTGLDFSKLTGTSTSAGTDSMFTMSTVMKVTFPATMTVFAQAFKHTSGDYVACVYEIHFLSTAPPTMGGAYMPAMTQYSGKKIYVPYSEDHSILSAYKTATNWAQYKSYIFEEPQGG